MKLETFSIIYRAVGVQFITRCSPPGGNFTPSPDAG